MYNQSNNYYDKYIIIKIITMNDYSVPKKVGKNFLGGRAQRYKKISPQKI